MLTLFILPSKEEGDVSRLAKSFSSELPSTIFVPVNGVGQINIYNKETPWYGVFYENEYIEEKLAAALSSFFTIGDFECLIVFKLLEDKAVFFPRFYKSNVFINDDLSPILSGWKHEKILNGWVHGSSF